MSKLDYKKIGIFAVLIISLFAVSSYLNLFAVIGSDTEIVMNSNPIELQLKPTTFDGYVQTRPVYGGCYTTQSKPFEATSGYYDQPLYWFGAERKLIGHFCTEQPILKIYSVTANIHFEDFFGSGEYPRFYLGTTDNSERSNEDSNLLETSIYSGTDTPTKDLSLNPDILTDYIEGTSCFDLYALGGYYKCNVESGMDATINYIEINYDPIECRTDIDCDDSRTDTIDSCFEYTCNYLEQSDESLTFTDKLKIKFMNFILSIKQLLGGLI